MQSESAFESPLTAEATLAAAKANFLKKTNSDQTTKRAADAAVGAAVQHNCLYSTEADWRSRSAVRIYWKRQLEDMTEPYRSGRSLQEYGADVVTLKTAMNRLYATSFRSDPHPKYRYSPGFRLSHAQKSLGVYLKHLWCMGLISEPPACPIDRIVLRKAGASNPSWGFVNDIDQFGLHIKVVQGQAKREDLSLAAWELLRGWPLRGPVRGGRADSRPC